MKIARGFRWPILFCLSLVLPAQGSLSFPQLQKAGDNFTFIINADSHVNRQAPSPRNPRPHNVQFREFVNEINTLSPRPAFAIFNGDIFERQAVPESTNFLLQTIRDLKTLPIAVTGNHDVRDFDVDAIFGRVQHAFNGTTNHTFSFDCGQWHFVVLPTKELLNTPAREAALLEWLDADLLANRRRPTLVFTHYHLLPVGTSQLEFYCFSIAFKNRLIESLTRHGNVKYVFSGHVHSGIQTAVKTGWSHRGANFIILPTLVKPRPFGEEYPDFEFEAGGCYTRAQIRGKRIQVFGRQLGSEVEHLFPSKFAKFDPALDPRAFTTVWDLPAQASLRNGGFEAGLKEWHSPFRYQTDRDPGYCAEAATDRNSSGRKAARLFVREKGAHWALGEFTELYQVIKAPGDRAPVLEFQYYPEEAAQGGGYVWLAGFSGKEARCLALLQYGPKMQAKHTLTRVISYVISGGDYEGSRLNELSRERRTAFWKLPEQSGLWHTAKIDLGKAFAAATGQDLRALELDRFIIGLGAWCGDAAGSRSTAWFDEVRLDFQTDSPGMQVDGQPFDATNQGLDRLVEPARQ